MTFFLRLSLIHYYHKHDDYLRYANTNDGDVDHNSGINVHSSDDDD